MKRLFISFLLIVLLVCNFPCNVYASDLGGGGYVHKWVGWTEEERKAFCRDKLTGAILQRVGVIIQPDKWTSEEWTNAWNQHLAEIEIASSMTYDEYIMSLISVDEENDEFIIPDTLLDDFYSVANIYIEEYTGWYNLPVTSYRNIDASLFYTQTQYNSFLDYCSKNVDENSFVAISRYGTSGYKVDNVTYQNSFLFYLVPYEDLLYGAPNVNGVSYHAVAPVVNWAVLEKEQIKIIYLDSNGGIIKESQNENTAFSYFYIYQNQYNSCPRAFFYSDITIRAYKTLDDLKQYAVGQRPYYVTENFTNYDSTIDNSTTITQTEIDNSVTYGDVYNYIINNYENPDGLTEDELRAILEEYLSQIGGGSGGGSGDDDGGSSGGGLGSFLEGLGSIGDAILSILGKLLEYIGKALELLTGTVTKVLDLIPSNVTNLLLGLFPFIPQEWVTAIELSLVLGVVLAVVGAFKK